MKISVQIFASLTALFFVSCATVISKSKYPVSFQTNTQNITVKVIDNHTQNVSYTGSVPSTAKLSAGRRFKGASYTVKAFKSGKEIASKQLNATKSGWVFGNVVFPGIAGFVVDGFTGSMFALPKDFTVASNGLQVLNYDSLTALQKSKLIKL